MGDGEPLLSLARMLAMENEPLELCSAVDFTAAELGLLEGEGALGHSPTKAGAVFLPAAASTLEANRGAEM